jgi:hypothetical protein
MSPRASIRSRSRSPGRTRRTESRDLLREALELRTDLLGKHFFTAESMQNLGTFLSEKETRRGDSAVPEVARHEAGDLGAAHRRWALGLDSLAFALSDTDQKEEAERSPRSGRDAAKASRRLPS